MCVWITIGYSDFEGNDKVDRCFVNKAKALDHTLNVLFDNWSRNGLIDNKYDKETFIGKITEYVNNHPNVEYWYFWAQSDFFKEIFEDWNDDCASSWIGLEAMEVE